MTTHRLPRLGPLGVIRAIEAEQHVRPMDAVVPVGRRAELVLRLLPGTFRPSGEELDEARAGRAQVVRMISTEQGAWWETLLGTEPSRKRLAPVMPLLPTITRSALRSSATSRIASAGSP